MDDLEVEVETTFYADKTRLDFHLPSASVSVIMDTDEQGAQDAERLVTNLKALLMEAVDHLREN